MYDVIVVGCGPAGLTSAIYALRANKKVLVLEKENIGGQISSSLKVENYPGFKDISGADLMNLMYEQAVGLGCDIEIEEVLEIVDEGKTKKVVTDCGTHETKTVIIATGCKNRLLGIDREEEFIGNGISFCVACDGAFYKGKDVAVIGGGNSAVINALSLAEGSNKVYLVQNLDYLTAEEALIENVKKCSNIEILTGYTVSSIIGDEEFKGITISGKDSKELSVDGMFLSIGQIPQSENFKNLLKTNNYNYFTSKDTLTDILGVYVAGDCREKKIRQLTTAVNDGTIAALEAVNYIKTL